MPFTAAFKRPRISQAMITVDDDGFYRGALNGAGPGRLAQVAIVDYDKGEPWGAVAWFRDSPSEWWMGRFPFPPHETYPPIMGSSELFFAADMDADVLLVETPARWCELALSVSWPGPTACVLDWDRPDTVGLWLSLIKAVQCETPTLAHAVESVLGAVPARQRLRVRIAEPVEPAVPAARERVEVDRGTELEPFSLRELGDVRADADREAALP